jgi:hypothetical protein
LARSILLRLRQVDPILTEFGRHLGEAPALGPFFGRCRWIDHLSLRPVLGLEPYATVGWAWPSASGRDHSRQAGGWLQSGRGCRAAPTPRRRRQRASGTTSGWPSQDLAPSRDGLGGRTFFFDAFLKNALHIFGLKNKLPAAAPESTAATQPAPRRGSCCVMGGVRRLQVKRIINGSTSLDLSSTCKSRTK